MTGNPAYCNNCRWCHFEVSREYVQKWADEWVTYCKEWDEEKLSDFGIKDRKPPSPEQYYSCFNCGDSYKNFGSTGAVPMGSTIQPILGRQYEMLEADGK